MMPFYINLNHHWKGREQKELFSDNFVKNILEFCIVLVHVRFAASKANHYIQYIKLDIQVASRVSEQLKSRSQEMGKYQKSFLISVSLQEIKLWQQHSKKQAKVDIKLFLPVQNYQIYLFCSKCFDRDFSFLKFVIIKNAIYKGLSLILQNCQQNRVQQLSKTPLFSNPLANKAIFQPFQPC